MRYLQPLGLAALSVTTVVSAQNNSTAEASANCLDEAVTNTEYFECTSDKLGKAERKLDAEYQRLLQSLGGSGTEEGRALIEEQEKWREFRNVACKTYYVNWGREGQVLHGPLCLVSIVNHRAEDLNIRYTMANPEDLSPAKEEEKR